MSERSKNPAPRWRFRRMRPGEINIDPIEGEFFTTEALDSIADALVREAIQNSLDAAGGEDPVTVRFSRQRIDLQTRTDVGPRYFAGLETHLTAPRAGLQDLPSLSQEMDCLLIEDFGTRGLQGDDTQYDDLDDNGRRNDFYYFWRNIGRTRKQSTDIGRWGLGKTVFQAASRINAFFGLTRRRSDGRCLLMGQAALRIHRIGRRRYAPYGYYGRFDGDLALPIEQNRIVEDFAADFGLRRGRDAGLSVLVPFVDPELRIFPDRDPKKRNLPSCFRSVIQHYFFPILSGRLVVELREEDRTRTLDADTLSTLLADPRLKTGQRFGGFLELARWAIGQSDAHRIVLEEPRPGRAPKLKETLIDPQVLEQVQERFQRNRRLAFRLAVPVLPAGEGHARHAAFDVYLERDPKLERAEDVFIRQGITIPEVSSLKFKGVRAIVSIADPVLSAFLGDAENPAHTDWERNNKRFKARYRLGPTTLDFVKTSPRNLVALLTQPKRGLDRQMLRHLFSLPEKAAGESPAAALGTGEGPAAKNSGTNLLQLSRINGGFRLSPRPGAGRVPGRIEIRMAYEVRSGNPFKKYTVLDFDLRKPPIVVRGKGIEPLRYGGNFLQVRVLSPRFRMSITGFDPHRDLRIRILP